MGQALFFIDRKMERPSHRACPKLATGSCPHQPHIGDAQYIPSGSVCALPEKSELKRQELGRLTGKLQLWPGVHTWVSDRAGGVLAPMPAVFWVRLLNTQYWSSHACCQEAMQQKKGEGGRERERQDIWHLYDLGFRQCGPCVPTYTPS